MEAPLAPSSISRLVHVADTSEKPISQENTTSQARVGSALSTSTGLESYAHGAAFEESVFDILRRRFGRSKPHHGSSDSFEQFIRGKAGVALVSQYHQLCDEPGIIWENVLACRELDATYFDKDFPDFFKAGDYTGSVSDSFARIERRLKDLKANTNAAALCSIIVNERECRKIFNLPSLFAASGYPSPMFFALALSAYLFHWTGCLDDIDKITKSSLLIEERPVVLGDFDLPSRTVQVTDLFGNGFYEYTFTWAYKCPSFGRINYATTIPYKNEPVLEKVQMLAQKEDNGFWRVVLLFKNERIFESFELTLKSTYERLRRMMRNIASVDCMSMLHVYTILFAIHEQINIELCQFMKQATTAARYMAIETREHPGRSEILHMSVLIDYTFMSRQYLKTSHDRLSMLDLTEYPPAFQALKTSIQNDTQFLLLALEKTLLQLKETQSEMRTFSEIKSAQRAGLMALLVAVYVPLAGVAGYLGMNTTGIVNGDIDTNVFWEAAIPLTLGTILIPLSATVITQVTFAASLSTRIFTVRKWPAIMDIIILSTILSIVIAHMIHWRTKTDKYFVQFFEPVSPYEGIITNSVLASLEMLKTLENCVMRGKRPKMWVALFASCTLLCTICAGLSVIDSTGSATIVTPIVWIMSVSILVFPALRKLGVM